uniref:Uncharacterized protein n=1 Tax=Arundo donax TaxID=35708 RepID=A0A0A9NLM7_ARUDO
MGARNRGGIETEGGWGSGAGMARARRGRAAARRATGIRRRECGEARR